MSGDNQQTDVLPASLESDLEFRLILTMLEQEAEPREASRHDGAACRACGRGDAVVSRSRREYDTTVKRHVCTRCEAYGATMIRARRGKPARVRSLGDVQTFDLADDVNARFRGTF
jgi:hypothetical protein